MSDIIDKNKMQQILNVLEQSQANQVNNVKPKFVMPKELMAVEKRGKLGETGAYATVKELTTLDYLIVKGFLDKENFVSEEAKEERLSVLLAGMSIKSIEFPDKAGKLQTVVMPPIETINDLMARLVIKPNIWLEIAKLSSEVNSVDNPETLKK